MLITRSDDGYFGLRQSLSGVFDTAMSSFFENAFEEHGLTEDGKTVAPVIEAYRSKSICAAAAARTPHPQVVSSHHPSLPAESLRAAQRHQSSEVRRFRGSDCEIRFTE